MKPWKRIDPTTVTKVGWRTITTKTFVDNLGRTDTYGALWEDGTRGGAVIAITKDKRVVIARQFRIGPEKIMDELPGGNANPGEDPQHAAERELLEETGYKAEHIEFLGAHHKDAYMNFEWNFYLATGCVRVTKEQVLESSEIVEVDTISIPQLFENARHDKMTDAVAVYWAQDKLMKIQQENA